MPSFTLKERLAIHFNLLPIAVYDTFPAVLFGRTLALAVKLGVFESLSQHPQSSTELAASLNLHAKGVELILPSLKAARYLRKQDGKYSLAPQAKKWLTKSSPHYIGNFLAYIELLHTHWIYLEETLKAGTPPTTYVETFTGQEWRIYTMGMMDLAKLTLPYVLPNIHIPANATNLLDVCGSHGLYSIELCRRHPNLNATIADFPEVLQTTKSLITQHHLEHRITLSPGDVTTTRFEPARYDAAFAFNIIHGFSEEINKTLLHSIASALTPGGVIYIVDQLNDHRQSGAGRMLPLMVGMNLLNEIGGNIYSFEHIRSWCELSGLNNVNLHKLSLPGVSLVSATKKSG